MSRETIIRIIVFLIAYVFGYWVRASSEKARVEKRYTDIIDFGILATSGKDTYSVGMRNGMRWAKSLFTGKAPEYETVTTTEGDENDG